MNLRNYWIWAVALAFFTLPALGQGPVRYTFFGGALLGAPNGFTVGAGLDFKIAQNVSFVPTVAGGRSGNAGVFTLDGTFRYAFHPDDEVIIPYILGGVGMAQWGSSTHGSGIVGVGARIPIGHHTWIEPEVRGATHGLARFTIGITKSF